MKPEHFKPFNVEHARAGAPYGCRNGDEATVLKWDAKNDPFQLIGVHTGSGGEFPKSWTIAGCLNSMGDTTTADLVMLPLGYIDGKPVFVGDKIEDYGPDGWTPGVAHPANRDFTNCRWPKPEKQYPVTAMEDAALSAQWDKSGVSGASCGWLRRFANEVLRHAIDNGYAATKEAYDQCSRDLGKAERLLEALGYRSAGNGEWEARDCAARDMAIAEAVRDACAYKTNGAWASQGGTLVACAVWKRIQEETDLAAIIATVPA